MRPPISQVVAAPAVWASGNSAAKACPHSRDSAGQMRTMAWAAREANRWVNFGVVVDIVFLCVAQGWLPEFSFLGVGEFFSRPGTGFGREAVKVARGAPCGGAGLLPAGFQPAEFFEAHEDGVEGAGCEVGLLAEGVAVVPGGGFVEESFEEGEGLWGDADAAAHLGKST